MQGNIQIVNRLKQIREEKGFSSIKLARAAGLHPSHLCRIENTNPFDPRLKTLIALSDALSVPIESLFHEKEVA